MNLDPPTSDPLLRTLKTRFGHPGFRPGQEALVRAALQGRDALGLLPTGGGKSLAYLLPAHHLPGLVLVVSPLIALMQDQLDRARACGLRAAALAGPTSPTERDRILRAARRGELDLLLTAPERLAPGGSAASVLASARLSLLVVDEAHCLASWGYDFRPAYRVLEGLGPRWGVPVLALTATATPRVRRFLIHALGLRDPVRVELSFRRPNLHFRVERVRNQTERWRRVWAEIRESPGPALVYASTRRGTEGLAAAFRERGRRVSAFHAGMSAERRAKIQARYLRGELDLVTATCAFGMGVDKADIRRVVHVAPPDSLEAYYQEAGRGGRDGHPAEALLLWHPTDFHPLRDRLDRSFPRLLSLLRARAALAGRPGPEASGFPAALDRLDGAHTLIGGIREAWIARAAARRRLSAVRRFVRSSTPEVRLLRYLGEAA